MFRRNYPSPDVPTENEEKPSTKRVSLDDYFRILTEQMGQQATVIAEIERRTRQAKSRSTGVTVTVADFGNAKAVPEGDWQYVLVNRPGVGERSLTTLQSFRFQLGNRYYTLPASGLSVFPYMGEQDFTVTTDPVSGSTAPTGNWSIEAIFTNRDIASLTSSSVSDLVLPPNLTVQGLGIAGAPAGGVVTVQAPGGGSFGIAVALGHGFPLDETNSTLYEMDLGNGAGALYGIGTLAYDGSAWVYARTNLNETLLASAAQTATVTVADQINYNARGLDLIVDVTAVSGTTPTLTVALQGKDPASGKYYTILASASITAVGTTVLHVYPGLVAAANSAANAVLPRTWNVVATIGGTTPSFTFSIGASVIL